MHSCRHSEQTWWYADGKKKTIVDMVDFHFYFSFLFTSQPVAEAEKR